MILRRLALTNYRKYRSVEIEFSIGLMAVVGKNGMGKTTLLEAVAFALYGPNAARDELLGCISDFAPPEEHCVLELDFSVQGQPHRIVRRLRAKGVPQHQAELFEGSNPTPIATGPTSVDLAIRKKLGMDYLAFTRSVFSKQKEVNALSAAKPEERRKAIRRMVGIEAISRACVEVHDDQRLKQATLVEARRAIAVLPDKEREAADHRKALGPARRAVAAAQKVATAASDENKRVATVVERLQAKRDRDAGLQKTLSGLDAKLRGARDEITRQSGDLAQLRDDRKELLRLLPDEARFTKVSTVKERLDKASGKFEERANLEREAEALGREVIKAKSEVTRRDLKHDDLTGAEKDERAAKVALGSARTKVDTFQRAQAQASRRVGGPTADCVRVKAAIAQLKTEGASGECPTCYRPLGDTYEEILGHLAAELARHRVSLAQAEAEVKRVAQGLAASKRVLVAAEERTGKTALAVATAKQKSQTLREARRRLADVEKRLRDNGARLKPLQAVVYNAGQHKQAQREYTRLVRVHERVTGLRESVRREPKVKQALSTIRKQVAAGEAEVTKNQRERKAVGFDPAAFKAAQDSAKLAQKAHTAAAVRLADARGDEKRLKERHETARRVVLDLQRQKARIAEDEEAVRYLEHLEALLKDFREDLAARLKPEIEQHASALLNQVTAGRYPAIELDDNYGISLVDVSGTYPLKRFSGGEEDLANLCLRLAISQVVSSRHSGDDSSIVVLDEVFGSQDSERRERILQALARLSETFQQVVLITHTEDINDRVPAVLRVAENAAHEAEVAWM